MNSKTLYGLFFILALFTNSCITDFNADLPSYDYDILIVEGNIVANTDAIFYLSKSYPINNDDFVGDYYDILYSTLTLIGSNGYQSPPATPIGMGGTFRLSIGELDDNVEYGLQIEYNGETYQSALSKPLHTPEIDSVSWAQPEIVGPVSFRVSTHDNTEGAKFFMWSYSENWEIKADYYTTVFFNLMTIMNNTFYEAHPAPYYYCWKSNASNKYLIGSTESLRENRIVNKQLFESAPGDDRFSELYSIMVHQKAISKGAFEYYQNKIVLNDDMGGLFTPQPAELSGNIKCITNPSKKVMGYIDVVKNTTQKRIFVSSTQISRPSSHRCELIPQADVDQYLFEISKLGEYDIYFNIGYRPAGYSDATRYPNAFPTYWSQAACTDCVAKGGSKNKPDFWPNDHE